MTSRPPDWLILGAAKAGTTSLAYWLYEHPDVYLAPVKEVRYFDEDDNYARGLDWYLAHFADAVTGQCNGEATPGYLWAPRAPQRIAQLVPDARLVALLRHPVDRAHSHFWHEVAWGADHSSFDRAIDAALDGDPAMSHLVTRGYYAEQLARYDEHFPREALLILLFDNLRADPRAIFADVCRHIGVREMPVKSLGTPYNRAHRRRSLRLRRAMERYRAWDRLPRRLANAVDRWNTVEVDNPPMSDRTRQRLLEHFAPHNSALEQRLGRPLPGWER